MKIQMTITVDIDPDTWDAEYHTGTGRKEIRADVVQYVSTAVHAMLDEYGTSDMSTAVRSVAVRSKDKESR